MKLKHGNSRRSSDFVAGDQTPGGTDSVSKPSIWLRAIWQLRALFLFGLMGFSGASFAQFSASQIGPLPTQLARGQQTTMPITFECVGTCAAATLVTVDVTLPKLEYLSIASLTNGSGQLCTQASIDPATLVMRCSFTTTAASTAVLTLNVRGNTVATPTAADTGSTSFMADGVTPTTGNATNTSSITLGGDLLSNIDSPAASTVSTGNTVTFTVSGKVNTPIGGSVTVADAIPIGTVINMRLTIPSGFTFNSSAPGGGSAWTCSAPVATYRDCSYTVAGSAITTLPPYTIAGTATAGNGSAITATSSISVGGASPPYADINTSNNTDAVTLTVGNLPNLTTAIKYQQGSPVANSNAPVATFTNAANGSVIVATATNAGVGNASASEVELRFVVPDGFSSTSTPITNGFTCAKDVVATQLDGTNGDVIVCTGLALNAGASASVVWPVNIDATLPSPNNGNLRSRVTMLSGVETSTGDNTASWNYAINNPYADLSVTQSFTGISASNGVAAGAVYTANLTVKNNGPVPAVVSSGGTDKLYATLLVNDLIASATADAASTTAGWTCSLGGNVGTGSGTRLVTCERPNITLAVAGTTPLAITLTVTNGALPATPVTLTHTSCVGSTALSNATKLLADGPTPGDPDASATVGVVVTGVTDIADCSSTGTNSTAQTSSSQAAKVRLNKEVSKDGGNTWIDAASTGAALVLNATTPAGSVEKDLWFRLTVDGVAGSPTINTLVVEDNLNFSGLLLNQSASGTFPVWSTLLEGTAISGSPVAVVPTYTGSTGTNSCGFTGSGTTKKLTCTFTDFAAGSQGVILVKLARPFEAKTAAENRATVRSPDSFLAPQPATPGPTDSILQDSTFQTVQPVFDLRAVASVATTGTLRYGQNITLSLSDDNLGPNPVDGATMSLPVDTTIFDILAVKCNGTTVPGPYTSPVTCARSTSMPRNTTVPLEVVVRPRTPTPLPGTLPDSKILTTTVAQTNTDAQCEYSYRTGVLSTNCNDTNAQVNNAAAVTLGLNAPKLNLSITDAVVGPRVFPIQAAGSTVTYRLTAANNYNLSEGNVSKAEKVQIANRLKFTGTSAFDVPTGLSVALASSSVTLTGTVTRSTGLGTRTTVPVICKQTAPNADVICELANTGNLSDSYLDVGETVVVDLPMTITGNLSSTATLTTASRIASDESLRGFETDYSSSWTLADNADWGSGTDNQARVNVYPQPRADLAMTKTAGGGITFPVDINQPVPFDLKVENLAGGNTVTKIQVTDTLPPGWQFLTGTVNGTDYTPTVTNGTYAGLSVTGFVGASACTVAAVSPATDPASQKMTCDLGGSFPSATDATNFLTVRVWARATEGVYKTPAVCGTNANNTAAVGPGSNGVDDLGSPLPAFNDAVNGNNSSAVATSVQCASIGGRTYLDLNGNNVQDGTGSSDDYGFASVPFYLRGTDLYGNPVSRTVMSDNTTGATRGDYLFSFLPPSNATGYTVTQTQPSGYINRNPLPGTGTATAGTASIDAALSATVPVAPANSVIAGIQLNAGQSGVVFNFPEMPNGTLSSLAGKVYKDFGSGTAANNNNGTPDALEDGIVNVPMTLTGLDSNGTAVNRTELTDASGAYVFAGLLPPDATGYTITEGAIPAASGSYSDGKDTAGNATVAVGNAIATNDRISGIRMVAGENATGYNFGELPPPVVPTLFPDLVVTKTTSTAFIAEGDVLNYTLTVKNVGQAATFGTYTVTDTLPATTGTPAKWTLESAAGAGWSCAITADKLSVSCTHSAVLQPAALNPSAISLSVKVSVGSAAFSPLRNVVKVSDGGEPEGNKPQPPELNAPKFCGITPEFNVCKVETPFGTAAPDLVVTKTTTSKRIAEGQAMSYSLSVKNVGDSATVGNYTVTDSLPATTGTPAKWTLETATGTGWTCAITADKLSVSCTSNVVMQPGDVNPSAIALTVKVGTGAAAFSPLRNVVLVSGGGEPEGKKPQPPEVNAPKTCGATPELNVCQLETPVDNSTPDMVVTKAASKTVFTEGNLGAYVLRVKNTGAIATSGVYTVTDSLPANSGTPAKWTIEGASGNGWTCAVSADKLSVTCNASAVLQPGMENPSAIAVSVRLANSAVAFGPLRNVVKVSGGGEPEDKKPRPGELANPPVCSAAPEANVCYVDTLLQRSAGLSGHVWIDGGIKKVLDAGDKPLPQWIVEIYDISDPAAQGKTFTELVRGGLAKQTYLTDSKGYYEACNLQPSSTYRVLFRDPSNRIAFPGVVTNEQGVVTGADYYSQVKEREGFQVLEVNLPSGKGGPGCGGNGISAPEQSLPLDPNGVVYDSITRAPVTGAKVTLKPEGICTGYDPQLHIINYETYSKDAQGNPTMVTGDDGFYKFLLTGDPTAPKSCQYQIVLDAPAGYKTPPSGLIPPTGPLNTPAGPGIFEVQPQKSPPAGEQRTTYHYLLLTGLNHQEVFNNHLPLDPMIGGKLVLTKQGNKRLAEVGDTVLYTITVRLLQGDPVAQATVRDRLPAGLTLVPGTVRVNDQPAPDPLGGLGPVLAFNLGAVNANAQATLTYRVRVGVGAMQGDGINRARAHGCQVTSGCVDAATLLPLVGSVESNEGQHKVEITGGVFTSDACVLGKVFVDCNNNHVQDAEELGIPGVRLFFEDGRFAVSDSEGKYSRCSITPQSHVLKVDPSTLPLGSRLTTTSNRNLGDAGSLFIDLKNGELHRADFAEGSCTNAVLEQVKARRTQGEIRSVEVEKPGGPPLRFQSKPKAVPQQGTDSANQPLIQPRQGGSNAR